MEVVVYMSLLSAFVSPPRVARRVFRMSETPEERLAALEKSLQELRDDSSTQAGSSQMDARLAEAEALLKAVRADTGQRGEAYEAAAPPPVPPPPPTDVFESFSKVFEEAAARPPSAPSPGRTDTFEPFPSPSALGVDGQRCILVFYAYDGIPKVETLLETFEDEAAECASCGCALVAVRRVVADDAADMRKAAAYEDRFPSINFVTGLEGLAPRLATASPALARGLGADWERTLYYEPLTILLDPNGGMRSVLTHQGLSARNIVGQVMRRLHLAVPAGANTRISFAEAEASLQELHNNNVRWAEALEKDESLRQPTRSWFDGLGGGDQTPLLAGVDPTALPAAIDQSA